MRTSLMVGMSEELKDAVGVWAQSRDLSVAEVVREAIAKHIGYDLETKMAERVENRGRPRLFANKTERRAAGRERRKAKRDLAKQLLADFEKQDADSQREAFAAAVEASDARKRSKK